MTSRTPPPVREQCRNKSSNCQWMSRKLNIERTVIFSCKAGCIALYLMNPLITNWAQKTSKMCFGEVASPYVNLEIFKYRKILTLANHYTLLNCLKEHQVIM